MADDKHWARSVDVRCETVAYHSLEPTQVVTTSANKQFETTGRLEETQFTKEYGLVYVVKRRLMYFFILKLIVL